MKTGTKILALSALSAVLFSASAVAKIEEGKLVIWINGDKGYNGLAEVGKSLNRKPVFTSRWSTRIRWKKNTRR